MDEIVAQLITQVESQKLRLTAIENALTNLVGFYKEEADGSRQGQIKFELAQEPIEAVVKGEVAA